MSPVLHLDSVSPDFSGNCLDVIKAFDECFTFNLGPTSWRACYSRAITAHRVDRSPSGTTPEPSLLLDVSSGRTWRNTAAQAAVIRLLPQSLPTVNCWRLAMNSRMDEAIESIREEDVQYESWFLFNWDAHDYLFACMRRASTSQNKSSTTLAIDAVHRDFKKCWDRSLRIQCVPISCGDPGSAGPV